MYEKTMKTIILFDKRFFNEEQVKLAVERRFNLNDCVVLLVDFPVGDVSMVKSIGIKI